MLRWYAVLVYSVGMQRWYAALVYSVGMQRWYAALVYSEQAGQAFVVMGRVASRLVRLLL